MQSSCKLAGLGLLVLLASGCASDSGGFGGRSGLEGIPGWQLMGQGERDANRQRQNKPTMQECDQMAAGRTREVQARAMAQGRSVQPTHMTDACAEKP